MINARSSGSSIRVIAQARRATPVDSGGRWRREATSRRSRERTLVLRFVVRRTLHRLGGEMADRRPEAYITGIGVVTPIGVGRKKFWSSLLAGDSGAGPITLFDPEGFEVRIAAEGTDCDPESFMDRKVAARTDRFGQMGLASAKLALEDAGAWDVLNNDPERVGLILGSGIGGVTSMEATQATIDSKGPSRVNPFAVTKIMPNSAAAHVGIQLGVQGPSIAGALACTCGTDMMGLGFDLIRRGD